MTKIAILGAAGRMGGMLIRCARRLDDVEVVAALENTAHPAIGRDAGAVAGMDDLGLRITDDTGELSKADVWIDFTFHAAAPEHARLARTLFRAMVIGTTGLNDDEREAVARAAEKVPIVLAPNMSVGVNLLFAIVQKAAAILGPDYDAEIVEVHHRHKKDSPSGTALRLAEKIAAGRRQDFQRSVVYGRQGMTGERPRGEIAIHASRAGDVVGDHTVTLASDGELIRFSHRATSREAFAIGALRAARWVAARKPGLYDMQDVLDLN